MPVVVEVAPNGEVRSGKQPKRLAKTRDLFAMVFKAKLQRMILSGELNEKERAVLFTLTCFLDYDGLCYVPDEYGQKRRLTVSLLNKLMRWDKSPKTLTAVLDSLERKGLIVRVRDGQRKYVDPNPEYLFCGNTATRNKQIELFRMKQYNAKGRESNEKYDS